MALYDFAWFYTIPFAQMFFRVYKTFQRANELTMVM